MMGVESLAARKRRQIDRPHQVEHDQVDGLAGLQARQCLGVFGQKHLEAFLGEIAPQQIADAGVVVDNDDPVRSGVPGGIHGGS